MDQTENEWLRANLTKRRKQVGWSQRRLSAEAGLSESATKDIESGKSQSPKSSTVQKLARALQCTVEELLSDPSKPSSAPVVVVKILQKRIQELETQLADAKELPSEDDLGALVYEAALTVDLRAKGKSLTPHQIAHINQEFFLWLFQSRYLHGFDEEDLKIAAKPALESIMRLVVSNSH